MSTTKDIIDKSKVVFYDGSCGLCNASVQRILDHRKTTFYFIPLQSEYSKEILAEYDITIEMDTLYYLENKRIYSKSTAVIAISKHLSFGFRLLGFIGRIIPRFIRDWGYDQVAKRRDKINNDLCRLPTPEEQKFFLDRDAIS